MEAAPRDPSKVDSTGDLLIVHGLDLSYFTGKIEAYFRAKGLAYRLEEMDMAAFRRAGAATGVRQMPQVETPEGEWLTDTPQIIDAFEARAPSPSITPTDPTARFLACLFEDLFDEWFWRPALYYRWAFFDDAALMGRRIAASLLRDVRAPFFLKHRWMRRRQKRVYLAGDGVTTRTAPVIEEQYRELLRALEAILAERPYFLGTRPTRADFGLFGPMFRHFYSDPTPGRIMRATAPRAGLWTARLWAIAPRDFEDAPECAGVPDLIDPFREMIEEGFLPYCLANEEAARAGAHAVEWRYRGAAFRTPVNHYRVWRFRRLRAMWRAIPSNDLVEAAAWLGEGPTRALNRPGGAERGGPTPPSGDGSRSETVLDRSWTRLS